jgi:hypothetical protein
MCPVALSLNWIRVHPLADLAMRGLDRRPVHGFDKEHVCGGLAGRHWAPLAKALERLSGAAAADQLASSIESKASTCSSTLLPSGSR